MKKMLSIFISIIIYIFSHEFSHFILAKYFGALILEFNLGISNNVVWISNGLTYYEKIIISSIGIIATTTIGLIISVNSYMIKKTNIIQIVFTIINVLTLISSFFIYNEEYYVVKKIFYLFTYVVITDTLSTIILMKSFLNKFKIKLIKNNFITIISILLLIFATKYNVNYNFRKDFKLLCIVNEGLVDYKMYNNYLLIKNNSTSNVNIIFTVENKNNEINEIKIIILKDTYLYINENNKILKFEIISEEYLREDDIIIYIKNK